MKVLLVNTNRMKPPIAPIGLDYLADSLRNAGHELSLLDLCFAGNVEQEIAASATSFTPEVVAVSVRNTDDCFYASGAFFLPGVREIVYTLRQYSDAPVVLGGVGFSIMPEAAVEYCGADFGIAGEGEDACVRLLAAIKSGAELEQVPGLVWWDQSGLQRNPSVDMQMDRLPPRTRSFVDNQRYFREGGQAGFETRRGCPMVCTYCADPVSKGRRSRLLPPRMVVEELRALLAQGIDHLHTCDCEFNIPVTHARDVCHAIIDAGLAERLRWYAYCSVAPFDPETAKLMRSAGCAGIDFGADSGSVEMLRRLGRDFGPAELKDTARHCRDAGIPFMYDLLVGGPGETRETIRESLDLIRSVQPDCVGVSMGLRVYDGTALAEQVRAAGPAETNPDLYGAKLDNERFLRPVFYVSSSLGEGITDYMRELVGKDERFLLPFGPDETRDYNYNDNALLVRAVAEGARGAYWDILRRMKTAG
jgi:radical SAM superfamily enzyme YgiQ (UPF0313 family)